MEKNRLEAFSDGVLAIIITIMILELRQPAGEALKDLLDTCGLEKGCPPLDEKDYDRLTNMIDADSINYSPARTFSDSEIRMLLDQIRRGY